MSIQVLKPKFHTEECLEQIRECLDKGWTGMGFKTVEFENKWKEYTGHANAHYLNSATVGLHLAVEILKKENGWKDGDEIITTPITFVSTNHAILYENLKPVFADVDEYLCLSPEDVEKKITPRTRAVIFVGYGGRVGRLDKIIEICKKHDLKLILDAAHMAGTRVNGVFPGTWDGVDVAVYSYQAVKNLPTADSGMICFANSDYDAVCRKLTWLGINKDTYSRTGSQGSYKWKYEVDYLGYKDHGNSIMAAIALVQLKYLDEDNDYRRKMAAIYDECFKGHDKIRIIDAPYKNECSYHIYEIAVEDREGLLAELAAHDIFGGVHYRDNTEYSLYSYAHGTCPFAHEISQKLLTLPLHLYLTEEDVRMIAKIVIDFAEKN
ncbi:MAG: DegT/DnrJ/EryC1/StrS family aminotransferase [Oscillospiraceae bacterium]